MFKKFILQGNRSCIRSDDEMISVDKTEADTAFKKYSKDIVGKYLKEQGFYKWKTNSYVRRNNIDLLEYIDLQKERYGSKTFTVNYAIMPLYVPTEYMVIGFGNRLGELINGKDIWWDYANDEIARKSFQNVTVAIQQFVLPWFQHFNNEDSYRKQLKKDIRKSFCGYDSQMWLEAAELRNERKYVIAENVNRLKLPQKLL
ncbi:MAG: DUF4304 domain-containing protein [Lachnospiraceae bacterium]|nr:DUF4304 domain-containing protein [Lachnospiraceae bacterium]